MNLIFDIDNCIADDAWRVPRIKWDREDPNERYDDYHSLSPWDKPRNLHLFDDFVTPKDIIYYFTARPERFRAITTEWINRNLPFHGWRLMMRDNADHRHSVDLKRSMLSHCATEYGLDRGNVKACFDDRDDVIKMYRDADLNAACVWIHTQTVWKEKGK